MAARVQPTLVGNCAIVYESDENCDILPALSTVMLIFGFSSAWTHLRIVGVLSVLCDHFLP